MVLCEGQYTARCTPVPLLFLIYVNMMPSLVKYGRLLEFADDTTLICSGDSCGEFSSS